MALSYFTAVVKSVFMDMMCQPLQVFGKIGNASLLPLSLEGSEA